MKEEKRHELKKQNFYSKKKLPKMDIFEMAKKSLYRRDVWIGIRSIWENDFDYLGRWYNVKTLIADNIKYLKTFI